jgi:hypothetical protein
LQTFVLSMKSPWALLLTGDATWYLVSAASLVFLVMFCSMNIIIIYTPTLPTSFAESASSTSSSTRIDERSKLETNIESNHVVVDLEEENSSNDNHSVIELEELANSSGRSTPRLVSSQNEKKKHK